MADFNNLRMPQVNNEKEIAVAKYLRQKYFFSPNGIDDPYLWTFNDHKHANLVLYEGTSIIGYAHIQFWPDQRAAMRIIVIDEEKRNKNAGSAFLALCENWLENKDIKSLHAESRPTSLQFYIKNSYIRMPFNDPDPHQSDLNDIAVGKIFAS